MYIHTITCIIYTSTCTYMYIPSNEHVEHNVTDQHPIHCSHVQWVHNGQGFPSVAPLQSKLPLLPVGNDCHSEAKSSVRQQTKSQLASTKSMGIYFKYNTSENMQAFVCSSIGMCNSLRNIIIKEREEYSRNKC